MSVRRFGGKTRLYFGLAVAFVLLGAVAGVGAAWQSERNSASTLSVGGHAVSSQPLQMDAPLLDKVAPVGQQADVANITVPPVVSVVAPRGSSMGQRLSVASVGLLAGAAASVAAITVLIAVAVFRRRALATPALLAAITLVVVLPLSAFAGSGAATQWTLPHSFSDHAYGLTKDALHDMLYFAEHMSAGPDAGRIGQLDLATNDLVEWPTTGVLGTSMVTDGSNVFFTEPASNTIGLLIPIANQFARWSLPTAGGDAIIFWADPEGNVWYFSSSAAKIGRLHYGTNEIKEWALAAPGTTVKFYGRDGGNMWFSLPGTGATDSKIGRLVTSTNQITLWPVPATITESVQVVVVDGGTVWFSGTVGSTTLHFGRLNTGTNEVTRWTIVPTDNPGEVAYPTGYVDEIYGYPPYEVSVETGRYRQLGVVDTSGKPWFYADGSSKLTRLDPSTNQLLEFGFTGYKLLDIDGSNVITALSRATPSAAQAVVFFNTTTSSETRYVLPLGGTSGFLRSMSTEFWFTAPANPGKIERLVVTP